MDRSHGYYELRIYRRGDLVPIWRADCIQHARLLAKFLAKSEARTVRIYAGARLLQTFTEGNVDDRHPITTIIDYQSHSRDSGAKRCPAVLRPLFSKLSALARFESV